MNKRPYIGNLKVVPCKDTYGQEYFIQDSSSVDPHIWVGIGTERVHLNKKQVEDLVKYLKTFLKNERL